METKPPICHHCNHSGRIRRHGQARSGIQRYLCMMCNKTFQVSYIYQGHEGNIAKHIKALMEDGRSREEIALTLGVNQKDVDRHLYILENE